MRLKADELYKMIKPLTNIVPKKSFIPIVQGMRVMIGDGKVEAFATDERVHVKNENRDVKIDVGIKEEGMIDVVMYPDAWAIIASMGDIEIEIGYDDDDKSRLVIQGDRERYIVRVSPGAEALDFPKIPADEEVIAKVMVTGRQVKRIYDSIVYACDDKQYWRGMGLICMDIADDKLKAMAASEPFTAIEVLEEVGVIRKEGNDRLFVIPEQLKMLMKICDGEEALTMEFTDTVMMVYVGDGMQMVAPLPAEKLFPPIHMMFQGITLESEIVLSRAKVIAMLEKLNNLSGSECYGLYMKNTGTALEMKLYDELIGKVAEVVIDGMDVIGSDVSRYVNIARFETSIQSLHAQEIALRFIRLSNKTEIVMIVNKDSEECLRIMAGLKRKLAGEQQ